MPGCGRRRRESDATRPTLSAKLTHLAYGNPPPFSLRPMDIPRCGDIKNTSNNTVPDTIHSTKHNTHILACKTRSKLAQNEKKLKMIHVSTCFNGRYSIYNSAQRVFQYCTVAINASLAIHNFLLLANQRNTILYMLEEVVNVHYGTCTDRKI